MGAGSNAAAGPRMRANDVDGVDNACDAESQIVRLQSI